MKQKLRNGALLLLLSSFMIACSGGSNNESQVQSSHQDIHLPAPEILDDALTEGTQKMAPFLGSLGVFANAILPEDSAFLHIIPGLNISASLINLFAPQSSGFPQVMAQLGNIEDQLTQVQNQIEIGLSLDQTIMNDMQDLENTDAVKNIKGQGQQIYDEYNLVSTQYNQYKNTGVFGAVTYLNTVKNLYNYASTQCDNDAINKILDDPSNNIKPATTAMNLIAAFPNEFWVTYSEYKNALSTAMLPYFESDLDTHHRDVAMFYKYFNSRLFNLASKLYASLDELRAMQLADAAYYYACPNKATHVSSSSFSNLDFMQSFPEVSTESSQNYTSYTIVAEKIYDYYASNFKNSSLTGLGNYAEKNLSPFTNAEVTNLINNNRPLS